MIEYVNRRGTDCAKWDGLEETFGEDGLMPFWVADMDFAVEDHITAALKKYIEGQVYGYYKVPESYYQSFIEWELKEHGLKVERDHIRFAPGVVLGFHYALHVLSSENDAVIIMTRIE